MKPILFNYTFRVKQTFPPMELESRHAGHHHQANIKYGYIIFGISLLCALVLAVSNYVYLVKWSRNGVPNRKSVYARLGSPQPLWLHVILWLVVAIALSIFNIHEFKENYPTFIKRIGRLGFYMVPFDILLVIRPSLMATSYLEYISLHKWISRIILLLVSVHGIGFFCKWIATDNVWKQSIKPLNLLGVIVFFLGLMLTIISSKPIRCHIYKLFYLLHNITVGSFLVLIFWHARPGVTDAIVISLCLIVFQIIQRIINYHWVSGITIIDKESSNLRLLRVTKPKNFSLQWEPGAHIRLTYPPTNFRSWLFPSHPYTIFSLPTDKTLELVVKKSHKFQVEGSEEYTISNPYSSLPPPFFQTADKVVILCGGSGISLGLPIFRHLKTNSSVQSELHWAISSKSDAFILRDLNRSHEMHVYVTRNQSSPVSRDEEYESNHALLSSEDQYELETLSGDTTQASDTIDESLGFKNDLKYHSGRPILNNVFSSLIEGTVKSNSWIVVCGSKSLIADAKRWGTDNGIKVYSEYYDF